MAKSKTRQNRVTQNRVEKAQLDKKLRSDLDKALKEMAKYVNRTEQRVTQIETNMSGGNNMSFVAQIPMNQMGSYTISGGTGGAAGTAFFGPANMSSGGTAEPRKHYAPSADRFISEISFQSIRREDFNSVGCTMIDRGQELYKTNDGSIFTANEARQFTRGVSIENLAWDFVTIPTEYRTTTPVPAFQPGMKLDEYIDSQIESVQNPDRKKWLQIFRKCVLPAPVKETIEEAIILVLLKHKYEEWGITESFEKGLTNSILIYGPPGTGKTMVSESIAAVLGKNLLKVTNAAIQSQIPGQAERNITKNFEKAKKENAVLLFDECDSLLYNRDAVGMIMASEINHLLGEIERFDGVVLLTTNRLGRLDPALQRRIIAKVELDLPGTAERKQIWQNLIPSKFPLDEDMDFDKLADASISGGEIKNAILLAARKAIATNQPKVGMINFEQAVKTVLKSKNDFERTRPRRIDNFKYEKQLNEMRETA